MRTFWRPSTIVFRSSEAQPDQSKDGDKVGERGRESFNRAIVLKADNKIELCVAKLVSKDERCAIFEKNKKKRKKLWERKKGGGGEEGLR